MTTFLWIYAIFGWCALIWFTRNATAHLDHYQRFGTRGSHQIPNEKREYRRYGVAPSTFNDETLLTVALFLIAVVTSIAALSS